MNNALAWIFLFIKYFALLGIGFNMITHAVTTIILSRRKNDFIINCPNLSRQEIQNIVAEAIVDICHSEISEDENRGYY